MYEPACEDLDLRDVYFSIFSFREMPYNNVTTKK